MIEATQNQASGRSQALFFFLARPGSSPLVENLSHRVLYSWRLAPCSEYTLGCWLQMALMPELHQWTVAFMVTSSVIQTSLHHTLKVYPRAAL